MNVSQAKCGMSGQPELSHEIVEILLVEDNPADARLFEEAMRGHFHVTVAETGAEALDRLFQRGRFDKSPRPDLVVVDLNVPILSGHEVIAALKSNSWLRSIPVIVFSISDRPEDIQRAYDLGTGAYILKSSSLAEAEATLSAFVDFWISQNRYPSLVRNQRSASSGSL